MQNVLKQCIVCMNVNVCMIYTVVLDTLLLDHLPGLKQPTQIRTLLWPSSCYLFVFFGKICHFCRWDICPSRIWPFEYFMLQKIFSLNRSLYVSPFLKKKLENIMIAGSRIFLCLNFMVDLCKAKPCLNQFINQTRSSSLGLHLFSAVTFHKIESRCLHSGGTMLLRSVWW